MKTSPVAPDVSVFCLTRNNYLCYQAPPRENQSSKISHSLNQWMLIYCLLCAKHQVFRSELVRPSACRPAAMSDGENSP